MTTQKIKCNCDHEVQDQMYGKKIRVCNKINKTDGLYRCTVCGKELRKSTK